MQPSSAAQAVVLNITEQGIAWSSDVKKKFGMQNTTNFNIDHSTRGGATVVGVARASAVPRCRSQQNTSLAIGA